MPRTKTRPPTNFADRRLEDGASTLLPLQCLEIAASMAAMKGTITFEVEIPDGPDPLPIFKVWALNAGASAIATRKFALLPTDALRQAAKEMTPGSWQLTHDAARSLWAAAKREAPVSERNRTLKFVGFRVTEVKQFAAEGTSRRDKKTNQRVFRWRDEPRPYGTRVELFRYTPNAEPVSAHTRLVQAARNIPDVSKFGTPREPLTKALLVNMPKQELVELHNRLVKESTLTDTAPKAKLVEALVDEFATWGKPVPLGPDILAQLCSTTAHLGSIRILWRGRHPAVAIQPETGGEWEGLIMPRRS